MNSVSAAAPNHAILISLFGMIFPFFKLFEVMAKIDHPQYR